MTGSNSTAVTTSGTDVGEFLILRSPTQIIRIFPADICKLAHPLLAYISTCSFSENIIYLIIFKLEAAPLQS